MLFGFLLTIYVINCILLIFIILLQKSKGGMGLGAMGGGTQMLFGGSGGQEIFQKTTWVMAAIFMLGSLSLAILKTQQNYSSSLIRGQSRAPITQIPVQQPASSHDAA
jgi:preprotein translocase subunit SecG